MKNFADDYIAKSERMKNWQGPFTTSHVDNDLLDVARLDNPCCGLKLWIPLLLILGEIKRNIPRSNQMNTSIGPCAAAWSSLSQSQGWDLGTIDDNQCQWIRMCVANNMHGTTAYPRIIPRFRLDTRKSNAAGPPCTARFRNINFGTTDEAPIACARLHMLHHAKTRLCDVPYVQLETDCNVCVCLHQWYYSNRY